jgi:hypothetical protein
MFDLFTCRRRRRLDFSAAAETDGHLAGLDDHRYLAAAVRVLQHTGQAGVIFKHVDVFERNFAPGEILTGSRSIGSEILAEDKDGFVAHRFAPSLGLLTRYYYERRIISADFQGNPN